MSQNLRHPLCAVLLLVCIGRLFAPPVSAHPMPNTVIAVSLGDDGARLEIAVPLPELRLALPASIPPAADLLAEPQRSALIAYLRLHCSVQSTTGVLLSPVIESLTVWQARDENVGLYQELRARMLVKAGRDFDPRQFTLMYDAVIHQVPNHFALVQIVRDFRAGMLAGDDGDEVGVIRFDFARNVTPALPIVAAPGSLWRGLRGTVSLGFRHVATGFDHVLFLITLLVVAPLRAAGGRWSLFQGWTYTARRFLTISLAFTLGHSAALMIGAYDLVPVPRRAIEALIAASILVAAIHAIRPLFAGREWLIAAAFGTVHGLAFAEGLSGLALTAGVRALAVGGFNLGIEAAQLVAMLCAVPLLVVSRWRMFHAIRVATMIGATLLAAFWMIERSLGAFGPSSQTVTTGLMVPATDGARR